MRLESHKAWTGLRDTLGRPRYAALGAFVALLAAVGASWTANMQILGFVLQSPLFSASAKVSIILKQIVSTFVAFKPVNVALIVLVSLLLGVNVVLAARHLRHRYHLNRMSGLGLLGALIAMLGVGCAACGSVVLVALFGTGAVAAILRYLPLEGLEFGILGCAIMVASGWYTAVKIANGDSCPIPNKN